MISECFSDPCKCSTSWVFFEEQKSPIKNTEATCQVKETLTCDRHCWHEKLTANSSPVGHPKFVVA